MAAGKTTKQTTTQAQRTLRTTINALIGARIEFTIHYPTKNSLVITADGDLSRMQLKAFVDAGGAFGPGKNSRALMILVPDLGGGDGK